MKPIRPIREILNDFRATSACRGVGGELANAVQWMLDEIEAQRKGARVD